MKIEGKIEQVGDSVVTNGQFSEYSFIKINGVFYKKIMATNLLASFIYPGNVVRMGLSKVLFGGYFLCSLQEEEGIVHKIELVNAKSILISIFVSFLIYILYLVSKFFSYALDTPLAWLPLMALCVLIIMPLVKAINGRNLLDGSPVAPDFFNKK